MVGRDGGGHRGRTPRIVLVLAVSALAGGVGAVICLLLVLVLGLTASLLAGRATSPLAIYAGWLLAMLVTTALAATVGGFAWTALCYYLVQPSERQRHAWQAWSVALGAVSAAMLLV